MCAARRGATGRNAPQPAPLTRLTFCVLVMRNGYTVTGESRYTSAEHFDAETERMNARQNALDKCGPLFGFALAEKLYHDDD